MPEVGIDFDALFEVLGPRIEEVRELWLTLESDDERRIIRDLLAEKLRTGLMDSIRYIKPTMQLREFIRAAWGQIEPSEYVHNWHIDAICEHLEAVSNGQIRNLIINIPPRCSKSMIVSIMWPAWVWTFRPSLKWLFSSYSSDLATEHSWKCRQLIQSNWYQHNWGHVYQLFADQNQKTRYSTTKLGQRLATAVSAATTGFGGDIIVCDDPNNVKTIEQDAARNEVINWWDSVMSTRLNNAKKGARVVIQQRCHQRDLTGHIMEKEGDDWVLVALPMEFVPSDRCTTIIGWTDPRTEAGELLCEPRFDRVEVDREKRRLGTYGASGQLQQKPAPAGGGMFKRHWFKVVELPPRKPDAIVRFWDVAGTEPRRGQPDPDWTVGTRMSVKDGIFYVEHVVRDRLTAKGVDDLIHNTAKSDGREVAVREEQEPGSSGKAVGAARLTRLAGYDYECNPSTGDKVVRGRPFAAQAEGGNVCIVRGAWNEDWLDELANFPLAPHDDQEDSASGAFNHLVTASEPITIF